MVTERVRLSIKPEYGVKQGILKLEKWAKPETVRVLLGNQEIHPINFDRHGYPILGELQVDTLWCKSEEANPLSAKENLYFDVSYTPQEATTSKKRFDPPKAISDSFGSLKDFQKLLALREKYYEHNKKPLHEYVVFRRYKLGYDGSVKVLMELNNRAVVSKSQVESLESFVKDNPELNAWKDIHLPRAGDVCPICGKKFTILDVWEETISNVRYKNGILIVHKDCWAEYRKTVTVHNIIGRIVEKVYSLPGSYQYRKIPSEYELLPSRKELIPWFVVETADGSFKIGGRACVIRIEWQDDFAQFDFKKLFNDVVDSDKSVDGRWINAADETQACMYLRRVLKALHSTGTPEIMEGFTQRQIEE